MTDGARPMDGGAIRRVTFEEELDRHGQFVFTGEGGSMLPMLRGNRDLLVIAKRPTGENGAPVRLKKYDVAFYRRGDKYITHRVLKVLPAGEKRPRRMTRQGLKPIPGDYIIAGDNNSFREFDVKEEQILGVLTAFVRDGREIPVTDRRYRLYARLWCWTFPVRAAALRVKGKIQRITGRETR